MGAIPYNLLLPPDPLQLRGVPGPMGQGAQYQPMPPMPEPEPPPKKPSILDRILARLFPAGASPYGGLLSPDQLRGQQKSALLRMGAQLLAESGPRPQGTTGPLEGLGHAFMAANWPGALEQAGQSAAQINELQTQMGRRRAIEGLFASNPAKPGETPAQRADRIATIQGQLAQIGGPEAEQVSQLLNNQLRAVEGAAELGKPAQPPVDPGQLWTAVRSQLSKWEQVRQAVTQYQQLRDLPHSEATDAALVAASRALTNVVGSMGGEEPGGVFAKIPEVGHLIQALASLAGNPKLSPEQRSDLIQTTDRIVGRLAREARAARMDAERQLRDAQFTPEQIKTYLPTWTPFPQSRVQRMEGDLP